MRQFKDKVCVITGAGSGIGAACAKAMAAEGAIIIGADMRLDMLKKVAAEVEKAGGTMEAHQLDVADRDAVFALAAKVEKKHGGADLVLNNAGVAHGATVEEMTMDNFQWVMDIDFWGVVHGTQAFLPPMIKRGSGHIANVSSIFGLIGVPTQAAYNAAKFGVLGFSEALRHEMHGTDVNVSTIHPGGINTNIVRHARFQQGPDMESEREEAIQRFQQLPRTQPEGAANTIMKGIKRKKGRILIGGDAYFVDWVRRLFPTHYLKFMPFLRLGQDD